MVSQRASAFIGSGMLIVGAILIGEVLHVTVVQGETTFGDPDVLFRAAIGLAFVVVGYRLDVHPREYLSLPSEREGESEETEFDESVSPLDDDALESLEAREDEDR